MLELYLPLWAMGEICIQEVAQLLYFLTTGSLSSFSTQICSVAQQCILVKNGVWFGCMWAITSILWPWKTIAPSASKLTSFEATSFDLRFPQSSVKESITTAVTAFAPTPCTNFHSEENGDVFPILDQVNQNPWDIVDGCYLISLGINEAGREGFLPHCQLDSVKHRLGHLPTQIDTPMCRRPVSYSKLLKHDLNGLKVSHWTV